MTVDALRNGGGAEMVKRGKAEISSGLTDMLTEELAQEDGSDLLGRMEATVRFKGDGSGALQLLAGVVTEEVSQVPSE